ncbi:MULTISPECIES: CaiB/BaiF CoA transferase family protein [Acinetobacter]|jgi:crotonobetainyl-CoA:carnitine CoA-transferase CaiB-like acyl-CoA transferase|uniref:CaiB/BaiF CoA transferase family protein n=1 Tax=Acinetobacter TaxID=469 RepID=UPI000B7C3BD9|nr:CaiB/BaiF CoA-transferase family protein [Acinetobacter johnsonii]MBL4859985.1 CoA transferase [Acinetobacter sp.]MCV2452117.1 CoA transferase [Acinetobacter johnsonii]QBK69213.1 CoA transferase [Acinetobacter johnsonii]SNU15975.1 Succinyl-CoA:(R)-benzylsuccinate CoA-transferase subunit BbsF [Acinetobacter johnsonii]HCN35973.1 CoA transferase [Acinetobacter johnsonii]
MGALEGIRVLDLSRVLAGPWCGQIFADLGAEVIKVERPKTGDDTRMWGPPWMKNDNGEDTREAAYYQSANRNKMSIAIDMATPEGQELVRALATESDVLIENYKAGSLKKYGLDYETLKEINPRLVYCSITGFGQTGPRAPEPGYDFIIQGMGGLMSVTGEKDDLPGGGPQKVGVAFADLTTGLYSTIAIQAALLNRHITGLGQHVDMALLDVQVALLANQGMNYLASGKVPGRYGNAHANIVPYQVFKAADQDFIIACGNDKQFVALSQAIGLPDLPNDPRFTTNALRIQHRQEIGDLLSKHFRSNQAKYWVEAIHAVKVPVGLINNLEQAFQEPQVQARNMLIEMQHPLKDKLQVIGSPIKLSRTPVQYKKAPPMLGEHTDEILSRIVDTEELQRLKKNGVIG